MLVDMAKAKGITLDSAGMNERIISSGSIGLLKKTLSQKSFFTESAWALQPSWWPAEKNYRITSKHSLRIVGTARWKVN